AMSSAGRTRCSVRTMMARFRLSSRRAIRIAPDANSRQTQTQRAVSRIDFLAVGLTGRRARSYADPALITTAADFFRNEWTISVTAWTTWSTSASVMAGSSGSDTSLG